MPSDAEERMIEAAERIAAEEGLGAMSLRAVQAAAGQRNKSAAQYHFGSREGLIERIVVHRMGPINERRVEMLGTLPDEATLADLVEVFVRPTAEAEFLSGRRATWARFVIAGTADPTVADVVQVHQGEGFRVPASVGCARPSTRGDSCSPSGTGVQPGLRQLGPGGAGP
ncbi:MAG: TetR family transcriptional regulator [Acidimicrobiales bacterium]